MAPHDDDRDDAWILAEGLYALGNGLAWAAFWLAVGGIWVAQLWFSRACG